jgi:hypothetical protein|tara:strand:- start:131 stop:325 length:195 start_codon:yes stop_codon:yes gene_type:complete
MKDDFNQDSANLHLNRGKKKSLQDKGCLSLGSKSLAVVTYVFFLAPFFLKFLGFLPQVIWILSD